MFTNLVSDPIRGTTLYEPTMNFDEFGQAAG
jgi:hypothetical protein